MTDLTEGQRLYAVGDVHGRRDLLDDMLGRIRGDLARRPHPRPHVVMLGDYVDRGPDTHGVIETLIELEGSDLAASFLRGNHDTYVLTYLQDPDWSDRTFHWLHDTMGGAATLASYGVAGGNPSHPAATHDAFTAAFPTAHLAFLGRCRLSLAIGGYLFAHAGIRPGVPLAEQQADDLIWIREPFLSSTADHGAKVVHGHTIVRRVEHHPNRIAVDTGAVRSGVLSCVVLEGAEVGLLAAEGIRALPVGAGLGLDGLSRRLGRGLGLFRG